ncbi:MAG: NAD(P)-binding protein, partial [Sandaracinaceae bacterium]|nr:NAD(P)-binding protein [Sandaracinaceae bacterium]
MNWQGKSVVIVGAGASGLSAAALLRRLGASVALNDKRSEAELGEIAEKARALGVE